MKSGDRGRYTSIQLLRIIACFGVFVVHYGQRVALEGQLRIATDFGKYGVHLFFIISGFLAAKSLINREVRVGEYYYKRAVHILPLYFFLIFFFFVTENCLNWYFHHIPEDAAGLGWTRYFFFLNGFVNSDTYFWSNLGGTWTIPVFLFFYLIAPIILKHIHSFASACTVSGIIILLSKGIFKIYQCSVSENIFIFFMGVIVYCAIEYKYALPTTLFFQAAAVAMLVFNKREDAYVLLFSSVVILFVMLEDKLNFSKALTKCIDYIDQRTYTLYLVHCIVFCGLIDRLYVFKTPYWIRGLLAVTLSLVGTVLVYRFYERPVQRWLIKVGKERIGRNRSL